MAVHVHKSSEALFGDFTPYAQYQVVDVVMPTTPGTDLVVRHGLRVARPNDVQFQVMSQETPGSVYAFRGVGAKPWQSAYIVLRSDEASWTGKLLLSVLREGVEFGQ